MVINLCEIIFPFQMGSFSIFPKTKIFYSLICIRTSVYQRVRNDSFSEHFAYLLNQKFPDKWLPVYVFNRSENELTALFQTGKFTVQNVYKSYSPSSVTKLVFSKAGSLWIVTVLKKNSIKCCNLPKFKLQWKLWHSYIPIIRKFIDQSRETNGINLQCLCPPYKKNSFIRKSVVRYLYKEFNKIILNYLLLFWSEK